MIRLSPEIILLRPGELRFTGTYLVLGDVKDEVKCPLCGRISGCSPDPQTRSPVCKWCGNDGFTNVERLRLLGYERRLEEEVLGT